MTANAARTAVGVFDSAYQANLAVNELTRAGFREDQIGVVARTDVTDVNMDTKGAEGAAIGALAGVGVGTLWAVGVAAVGLPAVGPAIAGRALMLLLASAAGGAAVGGLFGALVGFGIPEEEARYYEAEFEAGRTLVTVVADGRFEDAVAILRRHGGHDVQSRAATMSKTGLP